MTKDNVLRASSNMAMLKIVAKKLGELNQDVVYVGGCATALLVNDSLRNNIVEEIKNVNNQLKKHLQKEFEAIKNNEQFERVLPGHLNEGPLSVVMQRVSMVMQRLEQIIQG